MLHDKIKELRLKNRLTQNEMAEALYISQNAYSLIESGKTRLIDLERIDRIIHKLKISRSEIFLEILFFGGVENFKEQNQKDIIETLIEQMIIKDNRVEQLLLEVERLKSLM